MKQPPHRRVEEDGLEEYEGSLDVAEIAHEEHVAARRPVDVPVRGAVRDGDHRSVSGFCPVQATPPGGPLRTDRVEDCDVGHGSPAERS
jgi:hypothetical protein